MYNPFTFFHNASPASLEQRLQSLYTTAQQIETAANVTVKSNEEAIAVLTTQAGAARSVAARAWLVYKNLPTS